MVLVVNRQMANMNISIRTNDANSVATLPTEIAVIRQVGNIGMDMAAVNVSGVAIRPSVVIVVTLPTGSMNYKTASYLA